MFILSVIAYFLGRFAFRIIFILFGWAVRIFIGKTTARENIRIYSFTGICLLWIFSVFAARLLGNTLTEILGTDAGLFVRKLLTAAGIFLFPVLGGIFICGRKENFFAYALSGLKGFFYCPIMTAAFILMMIFGIIITIKRIIRREQALFMEFKSSLPKEKLEEKIKAASADFGEISTVKSSLLYSLPNRLLSLIREGDFSLPRKSFLQGKGFKIFLNKDDLMIEACKGKCHAVKIRLTERFFEDEMYFAKGGNSCKIEEKIYCIYKMWEKGLSAKREALNLLNSVGETAEAALFEDWEILRLRQLFYKEKISGGEGNDGAEKQNTYLLREK